MKKRVVMAVLLAELVAFSGVLLAYGSYYVFHKPFPPVASQTSIASKYANVTFDTLSEWDSAYELHVMYPQVDQPAISQATRLELNSVVDSFRAKVAARPAGTNRPYELNLIAHVNFANNTAINFGFSEYAYTGGNEQKIEQNRMYDLKTGARITTANLFKDNTYINNLSTIVRQALPKQLGAAYDKKLAEAGTQPVAAAFSQFEISDKQTIALSFSRAL